MNEDFVNGDIPKTGDKSGLYIAFFVRKSVISLPLCKCMTFLCSHEFAQILSSSGGKPKL